MHGEEIEPAAMLWSGLWLAAVLGLFAAGLKLPLETRLGRLRGGLYAAGAVLAGVGACLLANVAIVLHDTHLDLTREQIYTPSEAAMRAIEGLREEVSVTWFYRAQDPAARRTRDLLQVMERRNRLLKVTAVDPDREPTLARGQGIRIYNAAVIEAQGRRILVQSTDEAEIAIGVQRVLRERVITVCFLEGHGELPMDNFEFHTHLEGVASHSHGEASSLIVEMPGHGVGRFRRALEGQGYETRKLVLATRRSVPPDCTLLVAASPRTTFLPGESAALRAYLRQGGAALFLLDLGFVPEPDLARLLAELGASLEQQVVIDPLSHYLTDPEMVAVIGYDPHPVTRSVSLTFYPGVRPLALVPPSGDVRAVPLLASSRDSYARPVQPPAIRTVERQPDTATDAGRAAAAPVHGPRVLGLAAEGVLDEGARPLRAVVIGDGDFASNSFFPYMANGDLLLSAIRWLAREERTEAVSTRIPVPPLILLTGREMRLLFTFLVILLPASVIALGCLVWWRRR